jgi:hypothetical protein
MLIETKHSLARFSQFSTVKKFQLRLVAICSEKFDLSFPSFAIAITVAKLIQRQGRLILNLFVWFCEFY